MEDFARIQTELNQKTDYLRKQGHDATSLNWMPQEEKEKLNQVVYDAIGEKLGISPDVVKNTDIILKKTKSPFVMLVRRGLVPMEKAVEIAGIDDFSTKDAKMSEEMNKYGWCDENGDFNLFPQYCNTGQEQPSESAQLTVETYMEHLSEECGKETIQPETTVKTQEEKSGTENMFEGVASCNPDKKLTFEKFDNVLRLLKRKKETKQKVRKRKDNGCKSIQSRNIVAEEAGVSVDAVNFIKKVIKNPYLYDLVYLVILGLVSDNKAYNIAKEPERYGKYLDDLRTEMYKSNTYNEAAKNGCQRLLLYNRTEELLKAHGYNTDRYDNVTNREIARQAATSDWTVSMCKAIMKDFPEHVIRLLRKEELHTTFARKYLKLPDEQKQIMLNVMKKTRSPEELLEKLNSLYADTIFKHLNDIEPTVQVNEEHQQEDNPERSVTDVISVIPSENHEEEPQACSEHKNGDEKRETKTDETSQTGPNTFSRPRTPTDILEEAKKIARKRKELQKQRDEIDRQDNIYEQRLLELKNEYEHFGDSIFSVG